MRLVINLLTVTKVAKVLKTNYLPTEIANLVTLHAWKCVRKQRNDLLIECDWTQGADVPDAIKTAWVSYRQALRDVTKQSDPDNITWPTKPS